MDLGRCELKMIIFFMGLAINYLPITFYVFALCAFSFPFKYKAKEILFARNFILLKGYILNLLIKGDT